MGIVALLTIVVAFGVLILTRHASSQAALERSTDREVGTLLAGIPQQGDTLGKRNAPFTLEVYSDLKDPDSQNWFVNYLPAILDDDVRPGLVKIQYHSFKTNTHYPAEFVKEQTAALAAGAQDKLWNFVDTFYHEQRSEYATYVTENYLDGIARQVPGLNLTRWHTDRHTGRREEQIPSEDQAAKALGLYLTPSFRVGRTGGPLRTFSGGVIVRHEGQRPIHMIRAWDLDRLTKEFN
jgi:hypothetical protein